MASVCKDLDEFKYQSVWLTQQPLHSLHLSQLNYARSGNLTFNQILLFATAGFVTILCLLFNYLSLFINQLQRSMRALTIRLIVGSSFFKLYILQSMEFLMVLFSPFLAGYLLIGWLMPAYLEFAQIETPSGGIFVELSLYMLVIVALSLLLVAIPLYRIRHKVLVSAFQGETAGNGKSSFQNILLFFQLTVGLLFIFCTVVFVKQIHHMNQVDPGYDRTHLCFVEAYDPQFLSSQ